MSWKPKNPVLVCDVDGVLFTYEGFKGVGVFGEPVPGAAETLRKLHKDGWYIAIFTTRPLTPQLKKILKKNRIPHHDVNHMKHGRLWAHNPPGASMKPYADAYIDDRDWQSVGKPFTRATWARIYKRLSSWKKKIYDTGKIKH